MAGAVVQLRGGLGNQLWQLSAGLVIGGGHVAADVTRCLPYDAMHTRALHGFSTRPQPGWQRLRPGYYQHLRYAAAPADVLRLVRPVAADTLPCVVHLRGGDYLYLREYATTVPTAEVLRARVAVLGVPDDEVMVDYQGTLIGGRAVYLEAKHTRAEKMEQDRVAERQAEAMDAQAALGASCGVPVTFSLARCEPVQALHGLILYKFEKPMN